MHLSRYTDYAYRVLLYTATREQRCTLNEISQYYNVSVEHLRKVVHRLSTLNYIRTYKGKSGGMELNLQPSEINLGEIYRDFEATREKVIDCQKLNCILSPGCSLEKVLLNAEKAFVAELDKSTLENLLSGNTSKLLNVINL